MRALVLVTLVAGVGTAAQATHAEPSTEAILHIGSFHEGEVALDAEGEWLGLTSGAEGWSLRPVTASVRTVHDPIADMDHENTGVQVRVDGAAEVSWLIRSPRVAAADRVDGVAGRQLGFGEQQGLGGGSFVALIGGHESAMSLIVSTPAGTQTLVRNEGGLDAQPRLLFAGDLDGDGALDLIIDETDHYNVSAPALFLSSAAEPGEIVGKVASMVSVGC